MIILSQRVEGASLKIYENESLEFIGDMKDGLVVYVGFEQGDSCDDFDKYTSKIVNLRCFGDAEGKMNKSIIDNGYSIMIIPNFTLAGSCKKGNRPSFNNALAPEQAKVMFLDFVNQLSLKCKHTVSGIFGADMRIEQHNLGPVNLLI